MTGPTTTQQSLQPLPQLRNPDQYIASVINLADDTSVRKYWLNLFRNHFPSLLEEAQHEAESRGEPAAATHARCQAAGQEFNAYLDDWRRTADAHGRLDTLMICIERERVLRNHAFADPYKLAKRHANDAAIALLPAVLNEIDTLDPPARTIRLIEGVFAGNIFDLGATETVKLFKQNAGPSTGTVDFHGTRTRLKPRPWLYDDLDAWIQRLEAGPPFHAALLFVDNAGCDILLGMIPLARDLIARGTTVILAANTTPSLNDVTHTELLELIESIAKWDPTIGNAYNNGRLTVVPSGCQTPLIDLSRCSPQLCQAAAIAQVDLVILEGMGRAVESNFHTQFTCDALKLAMIKDAGVANAIHGQLYDLVIRYHPA